jgi:hypothetical protein
MYRGGLVRFNPIKTVLTILILFLLVSCSGPKAVGNETWSLIKLVTQGERIDTFTDVVTVRNCGIVQPTTLTCSAGTTNDLSVSLGGGTEFGEGVKFSIDASVSAGLGIGRETGMNVTLETPPDGFVYIFTVTKQFKVSTGDLLAQSSSGDQKTVSYNFNASCSIQVETKQREACEAATSNPTSLDLPGEIWTTDIKEANVYHKQTISDKSFSDFSYEADVKINDTSSEFHGLLFDLQSNEKNFYSFRISQDGLYAFDLWRDSSDSSEVRVLGPSKSSSIKTGAGQTNHLKVVESGDNFELFINNEKVGTVTDATYSSGKAGFISCTCNGSPSASATFSNAKLLQN